MTFMQDGFSWPSGCWPTARGKDRWRGRTVNTRRGASCMAIKAFEGQYDVDMVLRQLFRLVMSKILYSGQRGRGG